MSSKNISFEENFKLTTFSMRINRTHPDTPRDRTFNICVFSLFFLYATSFSLLLYSIVAHDIPEKKYDEASKNAIMAIVAVTFIFKYCILILHRDSIRGLIRIMNEDYELAENFSEENKKIVVKYSKRGAKVSKLWLWSASSGCAVFPGKAFVLMAYYYWDDRFQLVSIFDFTYPPFIENFKHYTVVFLILFLIIISFDVTVLTMYIGFDPLVPICMLHSCGQLEIINRKIIKLFNGEIESEEIIKKELSNINMKLQKIYNFILTIKQDFTVMYEFIMKSTTFLIPLTAFQITESFRNKEFNIEFISFLTGALLHFYIPCYYSDLLMEKSEELRKAIYSCGWENYPNKQARNTVLFMLQRTVKPLVISTVFSSICLDTFANMCRDAYTIFNLINASLE